MGKNSKVSYPEYSGGSVSVNGKTVATAQRDSKNNVVGTSYNMSDTEKNIYDSVQKGMESSLSNLFDISDNQRTQWANQLNALKNRGIKNIEDIYTPMETNLRNDVARRFGNIDNSVFLDNLNSITNKKASAIADLSNQLALSQSDLYTQELNNRMNTLSFLSNFNSVLNNNMLNYMNAAASNSASGNSYNDKVYNANLLNTQTQNKLFSNQMTNLAQATPMFAALL